MIRIEYIQGFSYVLEYDKHVFIFDYVEGMLPSRYLKGDKIAHFIVSCLDEKHFSENIYAYRKPIISCQDLKKDYPEEIIVMKSGDVLRIGDFKIVCIGHPLTGTGYFLMTDHFTLLYTGNMRSQFNNLEMTETKREESVVQYETLHMALSRVSDVDILITEVNPFLGSEYDEDAKFLSNLYKPKYFMPSNFGKNVQDIQKFENWVEEHTSMTLCMPKQENKVYRLGGENRDSSNL